MNRLVLSMFFALIFASSQSQASFIVVNDFMKAELLGFQAGPGISSLSVDLSLPSTLGFPTELGRSDYIPGLELSSAISIDYEPFPQTPFQSEFDVDVELTVGQEVVVVPFNIAIGEFVGSFDPGFADTPDYRISYSIPTFFPQIAGRNFAVTFDQLFDDNEVRVGNINPANPSGDDAFTFRMGVTVTNVPDPASLSLLVLLLPVARRLVRHS